METAARRNSELVRQTAELLSLGAPLSDVFERFCLLLAEYVEASVVFIALKTQRGLHIEFVYDHGLMLREAGAPLEPESQTCRVMQTGSSILIRGPHELPEKRFALQIPGAADDDAASAIFVPLRFGTRPIGVLSVQSERAPVYDEHDLQLLETCALYVAVCLQAEYLRGEKPVVSTAAAVDTVTGEATRRVFDERFHLEWTRAKRTGSPIAVVIMDVDGFKQFNATYGHAAGDSCLAQIAQAARACISRSTDLFARYGGESFAAVLYDIPETAAVSIAERMRTAVEAFQIPHVQAREGVVTASFGVAAARADDDDARALLRAAERAIGRAKQCGRNRVVADSTQQHGGLVTERGEGLPPLPTPSVGRSIETDAIVRSLALSRLTTVVGEGGIGKTYCSLAVARQLNHAFVHGAWFVDLAQVRHGAELPDVRHFADKHGLLVLDRCDSVREEVAKLCEDLLTAAPRLTVLATSREPLRAQHERVLHLSALTRDDAEALFRACAAKAAPAVIFGAAERAAIRAICARLRDHPQAILLAAAYSKELSPAELLEDLPQNGMPQATLDWSYARLDDRAQLLLDRLSVFAAHFDADAARDVCSFAPLRPGEAAAAFDELVENHVVTAHTVEGEERFTMIEIAREYTERRLRARGETATMHLRHADYYGSLTTITKAEWPQIEIALERCFSQPDPDHIDRGVHLLLIASDVLAEHASAVRIRDRVEAWIERRQANADPHVVARVYALLGKAQEMLGNREAALSAYEQARTFYDTAGDTRASETVRARIMQI